MAKILEIEELQEYEAYSKNTVSIFVTSYSPRDQPYSPLSNVQFGLKVFRLIKVEFGRNDEIRLEVPLIVAYGCNIASVVESVQDNIRRALEKILDKSPRDIRINVQGIEK